MAIVFEEQKRSVNWARIAFYVFIVGFIGFAIYYLFLGPSPKLDVVLPAPLEQASKISEINFVEPSVVLNSKAYLSLERRYGPPSPGISGRQNPFSKF